MCLLFYEKENMDFLANSVDFFPLFPNNILILEQLVPFNLIFIYMLLKLYILILYICQIS